MLKQTRHIKQKTVIEKVLLTPHLRQRDCQMQDLQNILINSGAQESTGDDEKKNRRKNNLKRFLNKMSWVRMLKRHLSWKFLQMMSLRPVLHIVGQSKNIRLGIKWDRVSIFGLPRETKESIQNDQFKLICLGVKSNRKPAAYDGRNSWQDNILLFETCAMLGWWSKLEWGLYLAVSLRSQAQGVLANLSGDALNDNYELARVLNERFAQSKPIRALSQVQLRARTKKANEPLPEL